MRVSGSCSRATCRTSGYTRSRTAIPKGDIAYKTPTYPVDLGCREIRGTGPDAHVLRQFPPGPLHVTWFPLPAQGTSVGTLVLVHDMSFVDRRSADTRRY